MLQAPYSVCVDHRALGSIEKVTFLDASEALLECLGPFLAFQKDINFEFFTFRMCKVPCYFHLSQCHTRCECERQVIKDGVEVTRGMLGLPCLLDLSLWEGVFQEALYFVTNTIPDSLGQLYTHRVELRCVCTIRKILQ
jgi:hypothetical protein